MAKYYIKKQRLAGEVRLCVGCQNQLSRYNSDNICTSCQEKQKKNKANIVLGDIQNVISKLGKTKGK